MLLLGPAVLYLIAFSVYPLVSSLVRSFEDYNSQANTWRWIGVDNYRQLLTANPLFAQVFGNTVLFTAGTVSASSA